MQIPEEAIAVHRITDFDVEGKPKFKQFANDIEAFISDCDLAGFNIKRFDLPLLETEFRRADIPFTRQGRALIDTQVIYHSFEQRNLEAAYLKYCGKKLDDPHRSAIDVRACVEILDAQIGLYDDLPQDVWGLHDFCCVPGESNWIDTTGRFIDLDGHITFNFGKHNGERLGSVIDTDRDYLMWMLHNADFSLEVQEIVLKTLNMEA